MYTIVDSNSYKWNENLLNLKVALRDIYFKAEYYKLYEKDEDVKGKMFIYKEEEKIAIYTFMLNKINNNELKEEYYDIESVYGYGGPLTNSFDKTFLSNFEESFLKYCNENKIVAEFIRFHPLIHNENIFNKHVQVIHNRSTVYLDLTKGIDRIWNEDIKSKNRNVIRKAEKNGLYVELSNDYETFKTIYNSTMKKVDARDYYYFDDKYYENIKENSNFILLNVKRENKVIAAAIFMVYGEYFHYHLAGSLEEELKFSPNNLLLWEAIKYGINKGYKKMHFGGGLINSLDDNLFKFKSSFSKSYTDFYIGKRIHNLDVYEYLIDEWEKNNNKKASILLQYRME